MKSTFHLPREKYPYFAIAMIVILLVPLVLYGYIGIYTRYVADDYETAGALARAGFWGAQEYWYQTWSGRVSYFALVTLVEMIGIKAVPLQTAVCLGLWLIGLAWIFRQLFASTRVKYAGYSSVLAACLVLFITLRSLNQIHQILFWQTGLLTYPAYLISFTVAAGLFLWRVRSSGQTPASIVDILLAFLIALLIGGLSEISLALQITIIVFGLGLMVLFPRLPVGKKALGLLLAALAGSLAALAVMALAPGNTIRATNFQARPGPVDLLVGSLKYLFSFLGNWIDKQPVLVAFLILLSFLIGLLTVRRSSQAVEEPHKDHILTVSLLLSSLAIFLFLWSCFFVSYYVMSAPPPDRALVIPQFMLVLFVGFWSWMSGRLLAQAIEPAKTTPRFWRALAIIALGICVLLGPAYGAWRIAAGIPTSRALAIEWDQRDAIIREAVARGEKTVTVWYIRDLNRLGDYSSDPDFLVNRAAADYYGLESIIALDKE